ncbi:MAG TPA: phosphoribosylglycinamide formyltransferase [Candidatus Binatia bacterium]|nr:phosphoribosylglycinamide formyltransferase [Candidatus Binatia bacterium]
MVAQRLKVAVLISGRGSNLQALIDAFAGPESAKTTPVEIVRVISNRPDAGGLKRAAAAGIATAVIDHKGFAERADFDAAVDRELRASGAALVVLAGFMRLFTEGFVAAWRDRLINVHPALLPSFRGLDTHRRALKRGVKVHGCTVHFVRHETDTGPIIAQAAVPVLPNDTPDTLGARVLAAEHKLFPLALRLIAEGRVAVDGDRTIITGSGGAARGPLISPAEGD